MSVFLPNTTTTADYKDAVLGGEATPYDRGQLLIANNPASVLVFRGKDRSSITQDEYPYVTPSLVPLVRGANEYIFGVKVKDALAGVHAQVSGYLVEPGVAGLGAGAAFTQQIGTGGGVTPGVSSVQIQKNGVLIAAEPILDLIESKGISWTVTDDPAATRVLATPDQRRCGWNFTHSVAQAIANGVKQALAFDTALYDTDGFKAGSTAVVPAGCAGVYEFGYAWEWSAAQGGNDQHWIDTAVTTLANRQSFGSGDLRSSQLVGCAPLAAGDVLTCSALHVNGAPININATPYYSPRFWGVRVSA